MQRPPWDQDVIGFTTSHFGGIIRYLHPLAARRDPDALRWICISARLFTTSSSRTTASSPRLGPIGVQHGSGATKHWTWVIDTVIPMREVDAQGRGKDQKDCMRQFRAAWDKFSADSARLTEFLQTKRRRL